MKLKPPSSASLRKYGLTPYDWERLFAWQGGRCAICERPFTMRRLPHVDHNHRTGLVRGLLCYRCNIMLGEHHEDADIFRRAAQYLSVLHAQPAHCLAIRARHFAAWQTSTETASVAPDEEVDR